MRARPTRADRTERKYGKQVEWRRPLQARRYHGDASGALLATRAPDKPGARPHANNGADSEICAHYRAAVERIKGHREAVAVGGPRGERLLDGLLLAGSAQNHSRGAQLGKEDGVGGDINR